MDNKESKQDIINKGELLKKYIHQELMDKELNVKKNQSYISTGTS